MNMLKISFRKPYLQWRNQLYPHRKTSRFKWLPIINGVINKLVKTEKDKTVSEIVDMIVLIPVYNGTR